MQRYPRQNQGAAISSSERSTGAGDAGITSRFTADTETAVDAAAGMGAVDDERGSDAVWVIVNRKTGWREAGADVRDGGGGGRALAMADGGTGGVEARCLERRARLRGGVRRLERRADELELETSDAGSKVSSEPRVSAEDAEEPDELEEELDACDDWIWDKTRSSEGGAGAGAE